MDTLEEIGLDLSFPLSLRAKVNTENCIIMLLPMASFASEPPSKVCI